ncbi:hypothetical protein E2C01_039940 [Portunus trituberculatus]|uniref:Uncharacterized protein n=1 Tax=Portunus trituberculatus TaxID=210409 RepID=A0A5B7FLJ0_PORTR|nr:hypothetical protein [Portunus trituberculatus]
MFMNEDDKLKKHSVAQGADDGHNAGDQPDNKGHSDGSCVLNHCSWRHEDPVAMSVSESSNALLSMARHLQSLLYSGSKRASKGGKSDGATTTRTKQVGVRVLTAGESEVAMIQREARTRSYVFL